MKLLIALPVAAGILSGCVGYAAPYPSAPVYRSAPAPVYRADEGHRRYEDRDRDRDRDGVPNRYDRDRDGDGVPNRVDRRPDNPYRY